MTILSVFGGYPRKTHQFRLKTLATVVVSFLFSLTLDSFGQTPAGGVIPKVGDTNLQFRSKATGNCLQGQINNGDAVLMRACNGGLNQSIDVLTVSGTPYVRLKFDNGDQKMIDGGTKSNGAPVLIYAASTHTNRRYEVLVAGTGYFQLKNITAGKCITATSTGAVFQTCNANDENQIWTTSTQTIGNSGGYPHKFNLPGKIEAEHYNRAPVETTPGNSNTAAVTWCTYYGLGVDVQNTPTEGTCNVAWTAPGEKLEYDVDEAGGAYNVSFRIAAGTSGKQIKLRVNGSEAGVVTSSGGGWESWETKTITGVNIPNNAKLQVEFVQGAINFGYMDFAHVATSNQPPKVSFTKPLDGSVFQVGANIEVNVLATDDGSIANVKLYINETFVRQIGSAPFTWGTAQGPDASLKNLAARDYVLKAVAEDNKGALAEKSIVVSVGSSGEGVPIIGNNNLRFRNKATDECLQGQFNNNEVVLMRVCDSGPNQSIDVLAHSSSPYVRLKFDNNEAKTIDGGATTHGSPVKIYTASQHLNRRFQFINAGNGYFQIRNVTGGHCIGANDSEAEYQNCNSGNDNQLWTNSFRIAPRDELQLGDVYKQCMDDKCRGALINLGSFYYNKCMSTQSSINECTGIQNAHNAQLANHAKIKPTTSTGTLGGMFKVNEMGAATYNVSIFAPAGVAGVTPSVSLNYNSGGGSGMLGHGWNLSATSTITRCGQTLEVDKVNKPIAFDESDQFCLDGKRLLVVEGVQGHPGSVYRTGINDYNRVTAVGGAAGNPDYFTIVGKDGTIRYMGLTHGKGMYTNSKLSLPNGKALTWYEARFEDNVGNPIRYLYTNENGSNFRLVKIAYAYGGNIAGSSVRGGALPVVGNTKLKLINKISGDCMQGSKSDAMRMQIKNCDGGADQSVSIIAHSSSPYVKIQFNDADKQVLVGGPFDNGESVKIGDNSNLSDRRFAIINTGNGFFQIKNITANNCVEAVFDVGELRPCNINKGEQLWSTGTGEGFSPIIADFQLDGTEKSSIEFNYEARDDVISGYKGGANLKTTLRLSSIDVYNDVVSRRKIRTYNLNYLVETLTGLVKPRSYLSNIQECVETDCKAPTMFHWNTQRGNIDPIVDQSFEFQQVFFSSKSAARRPMKSYQLLDINGDGKQDIVWLAQEADNANTTLQAAVSTGKFFQAWQFAEKRFFLEFPESGGRDEPIKIKVLDYNLDGRSDVALYRSKNITPQWVIYLSVPSGPNNHDWRLSTKPIFTGLGDEHAIFADADGDGMVDLVSGNKIHSLKNRFENPSPTNYRSNNFYKFDSTGKENNWIGVTAPELPSNASGLGYNRYFEYLDQGDVDGDGRPDYIGSYTLRYWVQSGLLPTLHFIQKLYLLKQTDNGLENVVYLGQRGWEERNAKQAFIDLNVNLSDINGDGLSDIVIRRKNDIKVRLNDGVYFTQNNEIPGSTIALDQHYLLHDYNHDGTQDLIIYGNLTSQLYVKLWHMRDEKFVEPFSVFTKTGEQYSHFFMDANGDGYSDYIRTNHYQMEVLNFSNGGQKNNVISSITDGHGAVTKITYESLNNSTHYTPFPVNAFGDVSELFCDFLNVGQYPNYSWMDDPDEYNAYLAKNCVQWGYDGFYNRLNRGLILPANSMTLKSKSPVLQLSGYMNIVTSVSSSSPSSPISPYSRVEDGNQGHLNVNATGMSTLDYYYTEAKAQAGGRGFLGFKYLGSHDRQSDIYTETEYRQDYPFVGSPLSTKVYSTMSKETLLSESHNVWIMENVRNDYQNVYNNLGSKGLGPLQLSAKYNYQLDYLINSSEANLYSLNPVQNPTFIPTCLVNAPICPVFSEFASNQAASSLLITNTTHDKFGNQTEVVKSHITTNGTKTTTVINYFDLVDESGIKATINLHGRNFTYQELGRLFESNIIRNKNGVNLPTKASVFEYYQTRTPFGYPGLLKTEYENIGGTSNERRETNYEYDGFGNIIGKDVKAWDGSGLSHRFSRTHYESNGRFTKFSTNAFDQKYSGIRSRNEYGAPTHIELTP